MRKLIGFACGLGVAALGPAALAQSVAVDPSQDVHLVSPRIFGMNFPSSAQLGAGVPVARWGGNSTTRYNYENDLHNTAQDYFFENLPGCWGDAGNYCANPPSDPKEQSSANAFLADVKQRGVTALFTIPTMGWVPKGPPIYGHPFDCGCPKENVANQDSFDPYDTHCGNGQHNNKNVDCGPPTTASVATSPAWAKTWVSYIVQKFGPSNGTRIYALDNEPALWSSTHHDIRKTRLTYDELWQRMRDYADAILDADPTAEISGPAEWGWPNYLCSDADDISQGCSASSPDRAAHGGEELVAWLLDQAKAYEASSGRRVLHYLDLHYYPQGGDPPAVTRSLWDPTYTDPSWINDKINLVPRMRDWASQHYPGTKIAVSEYDFYHHDEPVGAVAYAEVLGIFAREGMDMATAWSPPGVNEQAFAAFRLYLNFDGAGHGFEKASVRATVTGNGVQAYAAVSDARMTVALVNESGNPITLPVSYGNFVPSGAAQLYVNAGAQIGAPTSVDTDGGSATVTLPGTSIAMLVIDGTNPNTIPSTTASSTTTTTGPGSGGSNGAGGNSGAGGNTGSSGTSGAGGKGSGTNGAGAGSTQPGSGGAMTNDDTASGDTGGCGCRVAGAPAGSAAALAGLGLGLAALTRRRRGRAGKR